jgi:hypothetical protein
MAIERPNEEIVSSSIDLELQTGNFRGNSPETFDLPISNEHQVPL